MAKHRKSVGFLSRVAAKEICTAVRSLGKRIWGSSQMLAPSPRQN